VANVAAVISNQRIGFRLMGSTGIVFIALMDESRTPILSDNGFAIRWWYETGLNVFGGSRAALTRIEAMVVNKIGTTVTDAGPVYFNAYMTDSGAGASSFTYEKAAQVDGSPGVGEIVNHVSFKRLFGYDLKLKVGSMNGYQRIERLAVIIETADKPIH